MYESTEEAFYSPGSPFVDSKGGLVFMPASSSNLYLSFRNGVFSTEPAKSNLGAIKVGTSVFSSQQGLGVVSSLQYCWGYPGFTVYDYHKKTKSFEWDSNYPAPFGALLYSSKDKKGIAVTFDVQKATNEFAIIEQDHLRSWLPTQPGGFSIGEDGLLYRNGMLWSALKPTDGSPAERYAGRLASGHCVWVGGGNQGQESHLVITDPSGNTEVMVSLPWEEGIPLDGPFYIYNWGLGPWGEMYCLLPPQNMWGLRKGRYGDEYYIKDPSEIKDPAELIVVRNHLKYFGRLNDGGVRLRLEPSTKGEILGTYPNKTGFRILERTGKEETIAGQKSDWVKVRLLDGKEGWFFGSFVHNLYDGPNGNPPPWPNVPDW